MVKVKEILDQFKIPVEERYSDEMENVDIGNHSFTDKREWDGGFILEFTYKDNPNVILRLNDDRMSVVLMEVRDDGRVDATSWRMGKKFSSNFTKEEMGIK